MARRSVTGAGRVAGRWLLSRPRVPDVLGRVPLQPVMLTNALGVMRAVEGLAELVRPDGLLGVMSSGQGSISNNVRGGHEVYRGSKAALNQYMRSYAARHSGEPRAMALLAPGWIRIRTALGGSAATFSVEESIPEIVDVLLAQQGRPDLRFVDRDGNVVPW